MNRPTSVYLDLLRFMAAATVFLGHVAGLSTTGGLFWQLDSYMAEAVTIFFVLSGFVISYVTGRNENTPGTYVINRAARIYSVALPALALTFVLDTIGRAISPAVYDPAWGTTAADRVTQFVVSVLFAGRLWNLDILPGSCFPYWSLDYEIWYYVLFGLVMFAPRRWLPFLLAATCLVTGPHILLMFPLWLLGVACHRLSTRHAPGAAFGAVLCCGSAALWLGYEVVVWHTGRPFLVGTFRAEIMQDYIVGGLFAAHILGFSSFAPSCRINLGWLVRPIRWFAGTTFSLYLFHAPIAHFLAAVSPWPTPSSWPHRIVVVGGTFVLVLALAELTERRKEAWRRAITVLIRPLFDLRHAPAGAARMTAPRYPAAASAMKPRPPDQSP
jgi:peptidoglycan/LPS O-acetylase OafA/YrhL